MQSRETKTEDRSRLAADSVELRVHGVGGTTPEVLLGHPHPVQVAGDDSAGFYRAPEDDHKRVIEAYAWGGITSRSGSRALWLLLLPFALANSAGFMLENDNSARMRLARALLRLLSLGITVLALLWVGGLALDLLAFQCGGANTCISRHWWLSFFRHTYFVDHPAHRIGVAMALPVGVIAILWRTTRFTRTRYEDAFADEPVEETVVGAGDPAASADLSTYGFWHSSTFTARLASGHLSAAAAAVAGSTAFASWRLRTEAGLAASIDLGLVVFAGAVGITAAATVMAAGRGPIDPIGWLSWASVAAVAVISLIRPGPPDGDPADLPGYGRAALVAGLICLVLTVMLMIVLVGRRPGRMIPPVATVALGVYALAIILAGSHVRLADWLGDRIAADNQPAIAYSYAYDWFVLAAAVPVVVVGVVAAGVLLWLRRRSSSGPVLNLIAARYQASSSAPPLSSTEASTWLGRIARAESVSRMVDRAEIALVFMLGLLLAGSLLLYWERTVTSGSPFGAIGPVPPPWNQFLPAASWLGSSLPLIGLGVMYASFRNPGTRRRVGILWDVITFWPRWFHPLAPPPYSARAVPELGIRLARLVGSGSRVVMSAHSQGSVLAASSVARLPAPIRANLALLTHGSPLARLAGKFFPLYFGPGTLTKLAERIDQRWINLHRSTDPIGGPVDLPGVDQRCLDPESAARHPGDPFPPIEGHTFYRGSCYQAAVDGLLQRG
ncbi:MAG: hypothetical protein ACT4OP_07560 [Actinomycetota bacterium]